MCYLRLKQFDNAIADCTKALKIQPKCVKALYRRARSYELKNNLEEACIDISKAKMLNPKNSEVEQMYKKVITQRKTKEILEAPSSQKRISTVLRNCLSQVKPSCTIAMGTVYKIKAIEHEHDDNNNNNNKINMVLPQIHIDTIHITSKPLQEQKPQKHGNPNPSTIITNTRRKYRFNHRRIASSIFPHIGWNRYKNYFGIFDV